MAFVIVLAVGFITMLDVSIVNVALPSIEQFLGASASHIQWIVSGYSLTFGLALIPSGRIGDVLGRRLVFQIGLIGFVLSSLLCGFSVDAQWLVIMRIAQGVFAGIVNPQVLALIQELYQGKARARAFGFFGMTIGVSTAIGPLLGGFLVSSLGSDFGWRSVFLINVPIGLVVVPLAFMFLPSDKASSAHRHRVAGGSLDLDVPGIVLMGVSTLAIMWPFVSVAGSKSFSAAPWWLLLVAAILIVVLVVWERHYDAIGKHPILPHALLSNRGFVYGTVFGCAYFAGFTSIFVALTMYFQEGLGMSALLAGLAQMPFAIASALASVYAGHLLPRFGRPLVVLATLILVVGVVATAGVAQYADPHQARWLIPLCLFVAGLGSGAAISSNQTLTLETVPMSESGTASGLLQTLQRLGASIGLALITTAFFTIANASGTKISAQTQSGWGHALAVTLLIVVAFLIVSLIVAIADTSRRHK